MAIKNGTVKKTPLTDYANIRTNGLIAIKLDDGDELRWIKKTDGESDVIISTSAGQAIRFNEKDARPMGRSARGVRGVRLRPKDCVVGMDIVTSDEQTTACACMERGSSASVATPPTVTSALR